MTIIQLRYFLAICKYEKIRIASERLHVSEPTISISIKRLEEELGTPLFARDRGRLSLTDAGKHLQQRAAEVVASFDRLEAEVLQPQKRFTVLHLGAPATLSEYICAPLISEFSERYPSILFETPTLPPAEAVQRVEEGKFELAVCEELVVTSKQLVFAPILRSSLVGFVRSDHPLAGVKNVTPGMLKNETLVLLNARGVIAKEIKQWFRNDGVEPTFFTHSNRQILGIIFSVIKQKNAVAFLWDEVYTKCNQLQLFPPSGIAMFSLQPEMRYDIGIVRKANVPLSSDAQRFFDFCDHRWIDR